MRGGQRFRGPGDKGRYRGAVAYRARGGDRVLRHRSFRIGQPLERSALEAAVQAVPGVAGVTCINFRLRDLTAGFMEMRDTVPVGANQILRCDNDPNRPNNGALTVTVGGGR